MSYWIGQLSTVAGRCQQVDLAGEVDPFTLPAAAYRRHQSSDIPLYVGHDESWRIGSVGYLERSDSGGLVLVGTVNDDLGTLLTDHEWHLSDRVALEPTSRPLEYGGARILHVSLVPRSGHLFTHPVRWAPSDGAPAELPLAAGWYGTWRRAMEAMATARYRHRAPDELTIVDLDPVDETRTDPDAVRQWARDTLAKARSKPSPPQRRRPVSRAQAAREAAEVGASGFSWTDERGERHHVRGGGRVSSFG